MATQAINKVDLTVNTKIETFQDLDTDTQQDKMSVMRN